ncbi:unnamed protein product [Rangifer tarandus platyrhynchus]|uniref:Spermatid nuclear transition protein 3-like n=1 Tax=Rangifer tarandus platyrhynchus TaxID=3082113 RepID=A0ABN9A6D2_RANTA|nr:unnamed protein product [Rangifer tarandus platyrhynchus]
MRFASRKNGMKKTLCQRRGRRGVEARNMTMRVRRPLQGTFRKKIRSYATQSMKPKKTRKANRFFSGCGRKKSNRSRKSVYAQQRDSRVARNMTMRVRRPLQGTFRKKIRSYATQSMKPKKTRKANRFFSGCGRTKYDHEGQKTSTRDLQKENPIVCHSIDEAEENKKSKPFLLWLWT